MNCWEFMKCGREGGGLNVREFGSCSAYPNQGKHCARVTGTLCSGKIQGTFAVKIASCLKCDFYTSNHYDRTYRNYSVLFTRTTAGSAL